MYAYRPSVLDKFDFKRINLVEGQEQKAVRKNRYNLKHGPEACADCLLESCSLLLILESSVSQPHQPFLCIVQGIQCRRVRKGICVLSDLIVIHGHLTS